jgi:hypothetical protein
VIKRPFVIRQDVDNGKGEIVFELSHDRDYISFDAEHSLFHDMRLGVILDRETAENLRDALDTLIQEQIDKALNYTDQL